jgi:F-type H+-transporting ATPase subunit alpha
VGGNAQIKAMKDKRVAASLRLDLAAFRELEAFAQLGTELDKATQAQLDRGYRLVEVLKQGLARPMHVADQVIVIFAATQGFMDEVPVDKVRDFEEKLLKFFREHHAALRDQLIAKRELTPEIDSELRRVLKNTAGDYVAGRAMDPR